MAKYYFHISSGRYCSFDEVGVELSDLGDAHWYALKLIFKMRTHLSREDQGGWIVKVADDAGAMPLVVLSSSVPWRSADPAGRTVFGRPRQAKSVHEKESGRARPNAATEDGSA